MAMRFPARLGLAALMTIAGPAGAALGYYQYPAATDDALIFASEGDLWRKAHDAERATRLTTHEGWEAWPHVSPDGTRVAFTASFDAPAQAYVMPVEGGPPRQLTHEIAGVTVRGWSPDGRVLYTSRDIPGTSRVRELRLVDPDSGAVTRLPLRYATTGTFSDDGGTLFFVRHGVATVGDNARLYRGGATAQLWRWSLGGDAEAVRLAPEFDGPIHHPMFWRGRLYFLSDASGWDNLWSMTPEGGDLRQHTTFTGWRLQRPTLRNGIVHYQRGADIYRFDLDAGAETKVNIRLVTDGDRARRRWIEQPLTYMETATLGDGGRRVAITARGHVVVAGTDERRRVELRFPPGARAREAVLDPAGDWVYVILGEDAASEIWRFRADGSGTGEQLTRDATTHRWRMKLSPDGATLLHTDMARRLYALDLASGKNRLLYTAERSTDDPIRVSSFSPGGRWVAIAAEIHPPRSAVLVVDLETGEAHRVTSGRYHSFAPAFSPDGAWLYFLSDRHFAAEPGAPWVDRFMGASFAERSQLFAVALTGDTRFPFDAPTELSPQPEGDAAGPIDADATSAAATGDAAPAGAVTDPAARRAAEAQIDWPAAARRLHQVPIAPGTYENLTLTNDRVYLLAGSGRAKALVTLALGHEEPELETYLEGVTSFQLSADGARLLVITPGKSDEQPPNLHILPAGATAPDDRSALQVRTDGWRLALEPAAEWRQQFLDGWRMHRDFSFDSNMRGVDWDAVRDRLLPLTARIGHRGELDDLFAQMVWPLGILHSQIVPGEAPEDDENAVQSTLGAHYAAAPAGVRITDIYDYEFERPQTAPPLLAPGTDVRVDDVITHVNRRRVHRPGELAEALYFQAGQQVLLTLQRGGQPLEQVVVPLAADENDRLRYQDWVHDNATRVDRASDGEVGYLHLRAMGSSDIASFARDWFAQLDKPGMIIDVRDNNGGNIDSVIVTQLLRRVWSYWRFDGVTYGNMQQAYRGHLAVLINAGTYSDGDTFAAAVKTLEIAPLIGERTAGAGIWLSARNRLADQGRARIAESPQFNLRGEWLIEGKGVSPDLEVVAPPHALFEGRDAQLDAAVAYLRERIAAEPVPALSPRPIPPVGEPGVDADAATLQH